MKSPSIYFYCQPDEGNLQEDVIAFAEGCRQLGVPYFSSCDYWRQSTEPGDFLLKHDPNVRAQDCDVVVVSYTWPYQIRMKTFDLVRRPLPEGLFQPGRKYRTVYMDSHDGHRTVSWEPEFRKFDVILRSKLNRRASHPENMRPWASGLNHRIMAATENAPSFPARAPSILVNFGASHPYPHGTRDIAARRFEPKISRVLAIDRTKDDLTQPPADPYDALMWRQTGGRFSRAYYERLKHSQAVACFCGDLIPPMPFDRPERYLVGGNRAKIRRAMFEALALVDPRPRRSVQWDSFRFWETLAAGCVAFNIDLERYGVVLPVMPVNWEVYIGVDFDRVDKVIERIRDDEDCLVRIAHAGQQWAMAYYSPAAMTRRLLEQVGLTAHQG